MSTCAVRRRIFSVLTTAWSCQLAVWRKMPGAAWMPFSGHTMNILTRASFQPKLSSRLRNKYPLAQTSRREGRDSDSDSDSNDDDDDDGDKGASDKGVRGDPGRCRWLHIVWHEVPTDIHQHVYRKCNYSLKGSSILSDPSRSKWVLH